MFYITLATNLSSKSALKIGKNVKLINYQIRGEMLEEKMNHESAKANCTGLPKSPLTKFNAHVVSNACTWKHKNLHICSPDMALYKVQIW